MKPQPFAVGLPESCQRAWQVVVVGAGPAGAIMARELALAGLDVLLIDKAKFPRHKVCGCCLNGSALHSLQQAGFGDLPAELQAHPIREFRLLYRGKTLSLPLPEGRAVSRWALDQALIEAAQAAGVTFLPNTQATLLPGDGTKRIRLQSQGESWEIDSQVVVAADGLSGSFLRLWERFSLDIAANSRVGASTILPEAGSVLPETITMCCAAGGYVGAVRLEGGQLDLAGAYDLGFLKQHGGPPGATAAILEQAGLPLPPGFWESEWQGTPALTRSRKLVAADGVFLVGDAIGYVEPFTGEGMAWGLGSALAASPLVAAAAERLQAGLSSQPQEQQWQQLYKRLFRTRKANCRRLTLALRYPWLLGILRPVLQGWPQLAQPLVQRINRPLPQRSPRSRNH